MAILEAEAEMVGVASAADESATPLVMWVFGLANIVSRILVLKLVKVDGNNSDSQFLVLEVPV